MAGFCSRQIPSVTPPKNETVHKNQRGQVLHSAFDPISFNQTYKRTGTLWEGRFKSTLVDSDNYFLIVSRYIELNPVSKQINRTPTSKIDQ